jgi:holo-[acyl-carrier protein] synthase
LNVDIHRWVAKEAAYKALYPHFIPTWKDLVISKDSGLKPSLQYISPESKNTLKFHLSVSHDEEYTVANVLVEDCS